VEAWIVRRYAGAVLVEDLHPEVLEDLEAPGAVSHILSEALGCFRSKVGVVDRRKVDVGEMHEPARRVALGGLDVLPERLPAAAAQVDHDGHVQRIHLRDQVFDCTLRPVADLPLVSVRIDEGVFRAGDGMLLYYECRARLVVLPLHLLRAYCRRRDQGREGQREGQMWSPARTADVQLRADGKGKDRRNGRCGRL